MLRQHQDSLLPRFAQGEEGHETTTQLSCLVCVDRVSHTVDIHLSDTKFVTETDTGRWRLSWLTNPVSSNLEAGAGPPFQG